MTIWQRWNAPRNKRERRVAKIARQLEFARTLKLWQDEWDCDCEDPMRHLKQRIEGKAE